MVSPLRSTQSQPLQSVPSSQSLTYGDRRFWLLGIGAGVMAIHLTLAWHLDHDQLLSSSLLLWSGVCYLIWQTRARLTVLEYLPWKITRLLGVIPIVFVLLRSSILPNLNFLTVLPFIGAIGLAILAAGLGGIRFFWRELMILGCLALPQLLLLVVSFDISVTTAQFTSYLLWYTGQPVTIEGALLYLGQGAVNVAGGCSGQDQIFHLLSIAVMALLIFPFRSRWRWGVLPLAIAIAFVVNVVRVYLMALLVSAGNQAGFEYWHDGTGSLVFSMVSVGLLGWLYSSLSAHYEAVDLSAVALVPANPPQVASLDVSSTEQSLESSEPLLEDRV